MSETESALAAGAPPGRWLLVVEVAGEEFALELAHGAGVVAGQVPAAPPRLDLRRVLGFSPSETPSRVIRARLAGAGVVDLEVDGVCEALQVSGELLAPVAGGGQVLRLEDRVIRVVPARALAGPDSLAA